jgi:hypothetical protein
LAGFISPTHSIEQRCQCTSVGARIFVSGDKVAQAVIQTTPERGFIGCVARID